MLSPDRIQTVTHHSLLIMLLFVPVQLMADRGLPVITVCYNYACNRTAQVQPSSEQWQAVVNQFEPPAQSAAEERQMIRRAIAILEHIAGTQTPTFRDRGRNPIVDDWPGQMDCIDESINTKRYLDLLQEYQLLQWHRSVERAYRTPHLVDPHWAGQIIELKSQDRYIVDSWFLDNGNPPYIQARGAWQRKDPIQPHGGE